MVFRATATLFVAMLVACGNAEESTLTEVTPGSSVPAVVESTSTEITPGSSVPAVVLPEQLQFLWAGSRGLYSLEHDGTIPEHGWRISRFTDNEFTVTTEAGAATNDERFSDSGGCKVDEAGDYIWALSPGGGYLTLDVIQDVCSARADAMDGTFERVACPNFPKNFCLGDLEAGEHQAITFLPLVPVAEWERDRGAMTYTVPDGWSNDGDHPDEYVIQPQDRTGDVGIFMWSEAAIVESASPCSPNPDPNIARTPAAMATWLTDHPKLLTTEPTPASIGGLDGLTLDVSVRPDATLDCLGGAVPYVPMLVHAKATGMQWGFNEDTHMRFFLLDLGDGRTLVISIEAPDPATFESLLPEAMDILESIRFRL